MNEILDWLQEAGNLFLKRLDKLNENLEKLIEILSKEDK